MLLISTVDEWTLPVENVDLGESQPVELPHVPTTTLIRHQSALDSPLFCPRDSLPLVLALHVRIGDNNLPDSRLYVSWSLTFSSRNSILYTYGKD